MTGMSWCVSLVCVLGVLSWTFQAQAASVNTNTRVKRATTQDQETIMNTHHQYRDEAGAANMEYLHWSDDLASIASQWVAGCDKMAGDPDDASHSFSSIRKNFVVAEGAFDLAGAVLLWNLEKDNYDYTTRNCSGGKQCENYVQLVSATTTHIGCDYELCSTAPLSILFACYYGPEADVTSPPYIEGDSCSACASGTFFCQTGCCIDTCDINENDCECNVVCENCGTAKADTCTCECKPGFSGPTCSEGTGYGCNPPPSTSENPDVTVTEPTSSTSSSTPMSENPELTETEPATSTSTSSEASTTALTTSASPEFMNGLCGPDHCYNGGTVYLNKRQTRCLCSCSEQYHGRKCKKEVEEAEKGCEVSLSVNITMFQMLWAIFVNFLVRVLNSYCCLNVGSCCGGASITTAPLQYTFISTSHVKLGSGFPEGNSIQFSFLYYVQAEPQNSLCTYASQGRRKRQAVEAIELQQDLLVSVVEDAQDELAAEFQDCCNATIASIGPGQIYVDTDDEEPDDFKLPIYTIIAAVIVVVLFAVIVLLVCLITRSKPAPRRNSPQWKPQRGASNLLYYGNRPPVASSNKSMYFIQ